jgi:hypothetical protein
LPAASTNNQRQALKDFLALYAITKDDGDATNHYGLDNIELRYGGSAPLIQRAALFGAGNASQTMIAHVLIGGKANEPGDKQNEYPLIHEALAALGIDKSHSGGHHNHFHITIQAPAPLKIDNLSTQTQTQNQNAAAPELQQAAQRLLQQIQPQLGLDPTKEVIMLPLDVPPDAPSQAASVLIAQVATSLAAADVDRVIGVCSLIEVAIPDSAANVIQPLIPAYQYLTEVEHRTVTASAREARVTILQQPKHGRLVDLSNAENLATYAYEAESAFTGSDTAVLLVERGGYRVKVVYSFNVMQVVPGGNEAWDPYEDPRYCPNGSMWKIALEGAASALAGYVSPYQLGTVDVSLSFADLDNTKVGRAVGTSITLDNDAAGHGWFVDTTPESNDEFFVLLRLRPPTR